MVKHSHKITAGPIRKSFRFRVRISRVRVSRVSDRVRVRLVIVAQSPHCSSNNYRCPRCLRHHNCMRRSRNMRCPRCLHPLFWCMKPRSRSFMCLLSFMVLHGPLHSLMAYGKMLMTGCGCAFEIRTCKMRMLMRRLKTLVDWLGSGARLVSRLGSGVWVVLCDTHDTSILIIDIYLTIPVSPKSRYIAVYRSSTKYRETAQVSRVLMIPCSLYHLATCTLQACDAETNSKVAENHSYHSTTMSAWAAVNNNKYNPISYFCTSTALLTTLTKLPISKTDLALLCDLWRNVYWCILSILLNLT